MDEPAPNALYDPTPDERTFGVLAHALQMTLWFIAPLAILVAKSDSKFVRFHAVQALLLQLCTMLLFGVFFVGMFTAMFATIPMQVEQARASAAACDESPKATPAPCDDQSTTATEQAAPSKRQAPVGPPPLIFLLFPVFWLGYMAWFIVMIILIVLYSLKAGRGEWKGYPLLGRLAARFSGIQLPH